MPKGKRSCPVCAGSGRITEDFSEYEFETRDPITQRCLICDGSGMVPTRSKLPDGTPVSQACKPRPSKPNNPKRMTIVSLPAEFEAELKGTLGINIAIPGLIITVNCTMDEAVELVSKLADQAKSNYDK